MTKVYLHIGLNKTGTSSVQDLLIKNRDVLKSKGIIFPEAWSEGGGHHQLASMDSTSDEKMKHDSRFDDLLAEIEDFDTAIITSEALFNSTKLHVIAERLVKHDVKVVLYLRHHVPHLLSWYQQDVQASVCTANMLDYIFYQKFSYVELLDKVTSVFGRYNLILRHYNRAVLKNGDSVDDFFDACGIELGPEIVRHKWENNPSVSGNLLFYKKIMNLFLTHELGSKFTDQVLRLAKFDETFRGSVIISEAHLRYWNSIFQNDVHAVRDRYGCDLGAAPTELKGHLSPDWKRWGSDFKLITEKSEELGLELHHFVPQMRNLVSDAKG